MALRRTLRHSSLLYLDLLATLSIMKSTLATKSIGFWESLRTRPSASRYNLSRGSIIRASGCRFGVQAITTMNCYLLYKKDGTCEVICTRCFVKLGVADRSDAVREMESLHVCDRTVTPKHLSSIVPIRGSSDTLLDTNQIRRIFDSYGTRTAPNLWVALLSIALCSTYCQW